MLLRTFALRTFTIGIATMAGIGYFPIASGTLASAVSLAFFVVCNWLVWWQQGNPLMARLLMISLLFAIGILGTIASHYAEQHFNTKDDSKIVIDECFGMLIAILPLVLNGSNNLWLYVIAFSLFRCLDIIKPFGINSLQRLAGGLGVMIDDTACGILTAIVVWIMLLSPLPLG